MLIAAAFALGTLFGLIIGGMLASGKAEDLVRENYMLKREIEELHHKNKEECDATEKL
ncbi:hypothetical protein ACSSWA_01505 [Melioribacter sp. Ez-97]|uniref:hypothetical protein n=1 Tax=Melioribacter sp. Ez-97 TaxID=3423434 RepID=UPI003ED9479B